MKKIGDSSFTINILNKVLYTYFNKANHHICRFCKCIFSYSGRFYCTESGDPLVILLTAITFTQIEEKG